MCIPIGMVIYAMCDKGYRAGVCGAGKFSPRICLPCLFFGKLKTLPPIVGALGTLLVKKTGMGIQNTVTSANEKYTSLLHASDELIGAVKSERFFK